MNILGIREGLLLTRRNPDLVSKIIDRLSDYIIELANCEYQLGADLFWIAEPTASLISPKTFEKICLKPYQKIINSLPMATMLHVCGKTDKHTKALEDTGAAVLSIDYCTNIRNVLKTVSEDVIIMGNFSPMTLRDASKEILYEETKKYLEEISGFENVVKSTGCAIADKTPRDNILYWVDLCKGEVNCQN